MRPRGRKGTGTVTPERQFRQFAPYIHGLELDRFYYYAETRDTSALLVFRGGRLLYSVTMTGRNTKQAHCRITEEEGVE